MSFRIRAEAAQFFKDVTKEDGPVHTMFDQYYLCLMLGVASGRYDKVANTTEFVHYFVSDYAGVGRVIVALLIIAEASRLGVEISEKADVKQLLGEYLDPTNPTHLSDMGFQKLNEYASGGYSMLNEAFPERPRHADMFLERYMAVLNEKAGQNSNWTRFV